MVQSLTEWSTSYAIYCYSSMRHFSYLSLQAARTSVILISDILHTYVVKLTATYLALSACYRLKLSRLWPWRLLSYGKWRHVGCEINTSVSQQSTWRNTEDDSTERTYQTLPRHTWGDSNLQSIYFSHINYTRSSERIVMQVSLFTGRISSLNFKNRYVFSREVLVETNFKLSVCLVTHHTM